MKGRFDIFRTKAGWLFTAAVLALAGCVRDDAEVMPPQPDETAYVNIELQIPGDPAAGTRSLTEADECMVGDVVILVFDSSNGSFLYRADGQQIEDVTGSNVKKFTVPLKPGNCDLWAFANCKDIIDAYQFGSNANKTSVREGLMVDFPSTNWNVAADFTPLPMWGEKKGVAVTKYLSLTGQGNRINLIRAVTKVDITVDRGNVPSADFVIGQVNFYHWSDKCRLVPDADVLNAAGTLAEDVSGNTGYTGVTEALKYPAAQYRGSDGNYRNVIYTSERKADTAGQENPCLLINATYKGTPYWYKIEFWRQETQAGGSTTDVFLDLIRNHSYTVNITGVSDKGYTTEQEAYNAKAQHLTVEILINDDTSLTNIIYDGQYWLAWSRSEYELYRQAHGSTDTDNTLIIQTNYPEGWNWTRTVDSGGNTVTWLTLAAGDRTGTTSKKTIHLVAEANGTSSSRTAYIHFTAGRMEMNVKVTQTATDEVWVKVLSADGEDITGKTLWMNGPHGAAVEDVIQVQWGPEGAACKVSKSSAGSGFRDLVYASGDRSIVDGETLTSAYDNHRYQLKLRELDEDRDFIGNNLTMVKYGNTYTFTVTDHGQSASASVTIRSHIDIFCSTEEDSYQMGFGYTAGFRSTVSYRIEQVDNSSNVLYTTNLGTGTMTATLGEQISQDYTFRMRNPQDRYDNKSARIRISFPNGEFPDRYIDLRATTVLPNCYMARQGETIYIPVRKAWRGWAAYPVQTSLQTDGEFTAQRIWEDVNGLISEVKILPANRPFDPETSEIMVTVGSAGDGNAGIALYRDGSVVWSWHIWVTSYVPGSNGSLYSYGGNTFMDRNLGATDYRNSSQDYRNRSQGYFYQWGRKDPFPPPASMTSSYNGSFEQMHRPLYNVRETFKVSTSDYSSGNGQLNTAASIRNPTMFMISQLPPYDWWGTQQEPDPTIRWKLSERDWRITDTRKYEYDPCPEGWRAPPLTVYEPSSPWGNPEGFFSNFTFSYGILKDNSDYYPATGYMHNHYGDYQQVGSQVISWSCQYVGSTEFYGWAGYAMSATSTNIAMKDCTMSMGAPVRCVKEPYFDSQYD